MKQLGIFISRFILILVGIMLSQILALKARTFMRAARQTIWRHISSRVLSSVMGATALGFANAIVTEPKLSFPGHGFSPAFPPWAVTGTIFRRKIMALVWPRVALSIDPDRESQGGQDIDYVA